MFNICYLFVNTAYIYPWVINMNTVKKTHILCAVFVIVVGTLLHFVYDLSGNNRIVGYFSSVNESTWEHLKLLYWPFVLCTLAEYFLYGKCETDFFAAKATAVLSGMAFIIIFFYTYSGVLGFNMFVLDIFSFVASVVVSYTMSFRLLGAKLRGSRSDNIKGLLTFIVVSLCFVLWTYNAPVLGIFMG